MNSSDIDHCQDIETQILLLKGISNLAIRRTFNILWNFETGYQILLPSYNQIMKLETEIRQAKPFRNEYHKAVVNIIYSGKWMLQFVTDLVKEYGLTPQQYNILRILRGTYPEAMGVLQIRNRMLDRMSDASRIVELLRKKGLVERNTCEDNRRKMDVIITEAGLNVLEVLEKENETMDKQLESLDEQEIAQLNYLLDKVRGSGNEQKVQTSKVVKSVIPNYKILNPDYQEAVQARVG